jgi:hypothetical protein
VRFCKSTFSEGCETVRLFMLKFYYHPGNRVPKGNN